MLRLVGTMRLPEGVEDPDEKEEKERAARGEDYHFEVIRLCDIPEPPPIDVMAEGPEKAVLYSSQAYDLAYDRLYQSLPDCRGGCGCMRL